MAGKTIRFTVSDEQFDLPEREASECGLTISELVRKRLGYGNPLEQVKKAVIDLPAGERFTIIESLTRVDMNPPNVIGGELGKQFAIFMREHPDLVKSTGLQRNRSELYERL